MKKLIVVLILPIFLLGNYRNAEATVALPAAATAAATAIVTVGGVYYYLNSPASTQVTVDTIKRNVMASYFALDTVSRLPIVVNKNLIATLATQRVLDAAKANPVEYPKLNAATVVSGVVPSQLPIGTVVRVGTSNYKTTSTASVWATSCAKSVPVSTPTVSGSYYYGPYTAGGSHSCTSPNQPFTAYGYTVVSTTSPETVYPSIPATLAQFASKVAPTGSVTDSSYQSELDKMMRIPGYIPVFTNATGLPWAPPAGVLSPDQARAADTAATAAQAAAQATATAQTAAQTAAAAAAAAQSAAAANPTDTTLAARAALLTNQAIAAAAAADKAAADQAALIASQAQADANTDDDMPSVEPPELKKFSWAYGRKILGKLETAWPFNLLLSLRGLFAPLESAPVAPAFDLPAMGGNSIRISLAFFDPVASILRWAFTILLTASGIMLVVRWYRGAH